MGFTTVADLLSEIGAGKQQRINFLKTGPNGATLTAGQSLSYAQGGGSPPAISYSGTAGVATSLTRSTSGAFPLGPNVSTDTRHLIQWVAQSATATLSPCVLLLVDLLLYYPSCVITGTPTTMNNSTTLPRYTSGAGVMCYIEVQTATGNASPALTLNYDGDASTGQTGLLTQAANSAPIGALYQSFGGNFLPLAGANTGVKKINSYTLASGTTGTVAFVLCKPIAVIPLITNTASSERDYLFHCPSLPRVYDDACLGILALNVGGSLATTNAISGLINLAWG